MPRWIGNALLLLGSICVSAAVLEGAIALALAYPAILPERKGVLGKPRRLLINYFRNWNRWVVQLLPACARYDPEVTYTLRPGGSCRVVSREHTVRYSANRAGLRDSDAALNHPAVMVLGDSHAMGWGVAAAASFPAQLESTLGRRVLNAGLSSFATVRELILLDRLQPVSLSALVIQYCENDFHENRVYIDSGALRIRSEADYRATVDRHLRTTPYYPLKHVRYLARIARQAFAGPERAGPARVPDGVEADYFLAVLQRHRELIEGTPVVVLELNGYRRDDGKFIEALRRRLAEPRYAELARWVNAIDVSGELEPADYYRLDGHMRPAGHRKVAGLVAEGLAELGL